MASYDSVTKAFAAFDREKDNSIETADLAALCSSLGEPLSHSELEEAVEVLDPNDSGRISREHFMAWWEENVGESAMSPRSRSIVSPGGHSGGFRDDASAVGSQAGGEKRLTVVRHLRKQAQNDAQLLINRIALLRQEEAKARKKIRETQNRAKEMLQLKAHTVERIQARQQREAAAQKKQGLVRNRVVQQKKEHRAKMKLVQKKMAEAKLVEAKEVHAMRRKFKEERERQRKEVVERAKRKHQAVAGKKGGAQRAAEIKRLERQRHVIAEYERKIEEENVRRRAKEVEVRRMEQEELRLIDALKKVQVLQREAFEELENALAGGEQRRFRGPRSSRMSTASRSVRSTASKGGKKGKKRRGRKTSVASRGSRRSENGRHDSRPSSPQQDDTSARVELDQ